MKKYVYLIAKRWFKRVGIFTNCFHLATSEQLKSFWRVAYRDARNYAKISVDANKELIIFRGIGTVKRVWAKNGNCIGRVRLNSREDYINFNNNIIAEQLGYDNYNPNRIFN